MLAKIENKPEAVTDENCAELMRDFEKWRMTQELGYTTLKGVGPLFDLFDEPRNRASSKGVISGNGDGKKSDRCRAIVKLWAAMAEWDLPAIKRIA
jgi:hypothetical protein